LGPQYLNISWRTEVTQFAFLLTFKKMSMEKHEIEYMIIQKNQETISSTEEVEGKSHIDAAWKLQQKIKNDVDPFGNKGASVLVNLNTKD
jgi:hypothetical protein